MSVKVELGFKPGGGSGAFFTLDDATKGLLDGTEYLLGGEILSDVTEYVRSFQIGRGKSFELDRFTAGGATIVFNNDTRVFDPEYEASPYYGQIEPKRKVRISVDDIVQFEGTVDDWDIQYQLGGYSAAVAKASDGTKVLANINISDFDPDEQLAGDRVTSVLDLIDWPTDKRDVSIGTQTVASQFVSNVNSFQYLQQVADSEPGELFISREGNVKFVDRDATVTSTTILFSDQGTGIPYTDILATVGSELLFNNITVTSPAGTANARNADSILNYGEIDYTLDTLVAGETELQALANFLLGAYSKPRYRVSSLTVNLADLTVPQRTTLLSKELGDVIGVTFTPSGIPPAIVTYARLISISESISPASETYTIGLEPLVGINLVLDNSEFGRLDEDYTLAGPYNAWTLSDEIYGRLSAGMALS